MRLSNPRQRGTPPGVPSAETMDPIGGREQGGRNGMQEPHLYLPGMDPSDPPRPRPSQAQASQGLTRPWEASQGAEIRGSAHQVPRSRQRWTAPGKQSRGPGKTLNLADTRNTAITHPGTNLRITTPS